MSDLSVPRAYEILAYAADAYGFDNCNPEFQRFFRDVLDSGVDLKSFRRYSAEEMRAAFEVVWADSQKGFDPAKHCMLDNGNYIDCEMLDYYD